MAGFADASRIRQLCKQYPKRHGREAETIEIGRVLRGRLCEVIREQSEDYKGRWNAISGEWNVISGMGG